ncbi:HNH endonuclease [Massilia brevitalea]|uniref:HNH endonuclease n=1 Tax=Massilia brevitalea TaxID=442526 RepID=UPI00351CD9A0
MVDKYTKKKKATDWTKRTLSDLRTRLRAEVIRSQGSACAYCRRKISEELGLHDLDHILPKGVAPYARFTYERMNLVASCKRCNRNKLDLDVLKNGPLAADASARVRRLSLGASLCSSLLQSYSHSRRTVL